MRGLFVHLPNQLPEFERTSPHAQEKTAHVATELSEVGKEIADRGGGHNAGTDQSRDESSISAPSPVEDASEESAGTDACTEAESDAEP